MYDRAVLTLLVSSMKRSIEFYTKTLGLPLVARDGGHWAEVEAPGVRIGLHAGGASGIGPRTTDKDQPVVSVGLVVDDLEARVADLEAKGVPFAGPVRGKDGPRPQRYFVDPDGHAFYLIELRAATKPRPKKR